MSYNPHADRFIATSYSSIEVGHIDTKTRTVPYVIERPLDVTHEEAYAIQGGCGTTIKMYGVPRGQIAKMGYVAFSAGHAHHETDHPIRANAEDIEITVEALGIDSLHLIGHSRGAVDLTLAAAYLPAHVQSLTAIAPAMVIDRTSQSNLMYRGSLAAMSDAGRFFTANNPLREIQTILDCARTFFGRSAVMNAELERLSSGNMHERLRLLKRLPLAVGGKALNLFMVAGAADLLFDSKKLVRSAHVVPFDAHLVYGGRDSGHLGFTRDPGFAKAAVTLQESSDQDIHLAA